MATRPFSFISGPVLIDSADAPDKNKPRMQVLLSTIDFIGSNNVHPVRTSIFYTGNFTIGECIQLWGSAAHDGTRDGILRIFGSSVERFSWASPMDDDYEDKVPADRGFMVIAQGRVDTEAIGREFVMSGEIFGDGANRSFKWKVQIPNNARFANLRLPRIGQTFGVRGQIDHRSASGLYVLVAHDVCLPENNTAPSTPSPGKKPRKNRARKSTTQVCEEAPSEFVGGAATCNAEAGPSGVPRDEVDAAPTTGQATVQGVGDQRALRSLGGADQGKKKEEKK